MISTISKSAARRENAGVTPIKLKSSQTNCLRAFSIMLLQVSPALQDSVVQDMHRVLLKLV